MSAELDLALELADAADAISPLMLSDYAALVPIVEEAGGRTGFTAASARTACSTRRSSPA